MAIPKRIAVTGAAGHIGYSLIFRIAAGEMLGTEQPVSLQLLEIPPAMDALRGVVMELRDSAYPLLHDIVATDQPEEAFEGADIALLVGAKPRGKGMERSDLLRENAKIFSVQGRALDQKANRDVKVLVVGNPANTNALIASANAPSLDRRQFTAMTRLDHNRAISQLAEKTGCHTTSIHKMTIWGNHSTTQYPDLRHAVVDGRAATELVDAGWITDNFIPTVQKRGAAIIAARGASSAASAGAAAIDHVRDWALGSPAGDWVSMAVVSDGSYGAPEGVIFSFPVTCKGGDWEIVQGLDIDDFSRERLERTGAELLAEREGVAELL